MSNILTGLRANQDLHLGNYLGAIKPMVKLQQELNAGDKLFMFVPDLHSFTTPIEHENFYANIIDNVKWFVASGVDDENQQTLLYRQSRIAAHSELTWILSCFTNFGEARRMTEFKDKSRLVVKTEEEMVLYYQNLQRDMYTMFAGATKSEHKRNSGEIYTKLDEHFREEINKYASALNQPTQPTVGLFSYPVLMAADILLYDSDYVPVGDDQKQHMELARTIAERMNNRFGDLFTVPKPWQQQLEYAKQELSLRVMSLSNPENKMSKSIDDPRGTIKLSDTPEEAEKKVMSATTDSVGSINYDPQNQPGIANLIHIAAGLSGKPIEEISSQWSGNTSYGDFKAFVAELVKEFLIAIQSKYSEVTDEYVEEVLQRGEVQAKELADEKLIKVQKALGLRR